MRTIKLTEQEYQAVKEWVEAALRPTSGDRICAVLPPKGKLELLAMAIHKLRVVERQ